MKNLLFTLFGSLRLEFSKSVAQGETQWELLEESWRNRPAFALPEIRIVTMPTSCHWTPWEELDRQHTPG